MSTNLDIRAFQRPLELRAVNRPGYLPKGLQGYAVVYGVESRDMGGWKEIIQRGAMTESLKAGKDVRLLFQHDNKQVLARESAGNLVLKEDENGVYFTADLIDTQLNRDTLASIEARNLDAMSFGMPVSSVERVFTRSADKRSIGTVTRAEIVEISVVTWPVYEATTVSARCAEQFNTFMQHDAAGKSTSCGIPRARQALAHRKHRY